MKLSRVIEYIGSPPAGIDPTLLDSEVGSFVIDSRESGPNSVFFALSQPEYRQNGFNGEFEDSTVYVTAAFERGAVAAVVRRDRFEEYRDELSKFESRLIFVDDSIAALQRLAHRVYLDWGRKVVAITGSAGKTTAKELTAHLLDFGGNKVLRNIKNYNNGLGHPLTVLNLVADYSYDIAVLEMGMSTPLHEIERLCRITPPDIAVVLNVLPVHREHLGSIERIAQAKAEIVQGMKDGGTAVLNADDFRVADMAAFSKGSVITYGMRGTADVSAENIIVSGFGSTTFDVNIRGEKRSVEFPLDGTHNIMNALAASAAAYAAGMEIDAIARALSTVEAPPQRGVLMHFKEGFTIVNDSYNSNPDALLSMVRTLISGSPADSRKIVVAGEMLELGPDTENIHTETGRKLGAESIDMLLGVRGMARSLVSGAIEAGVIDARFCEDSALAGELLADQVRPGDVVLVKGSRGVRTEIVIDKLLERFTLRGK
ncbi:MAG: UDP-N-acetylmuramoyl-tripeptide--D-alanyl-D-alanine ligase [Acidobacteriota bacterium]|nr:MAG: UDP-N-acetylmuramoyl-tripeptide--D-alanyl-D-alanine ligase [Acidobacteriota bacterium]